MLNLFCSVESTAPLEPCCQGRPYCEQHGAQSPNGRIKINSTELDDGVLSVLKTASGSVPLGTDVLLWSKDGSIVTLYESGDAEVATLYPKGISACSLSPDESLIALISADESTLALLNVYTWEDESYEGIRLHEGCRGPHDGSISSPFDSQKPQLTWRSDGAFICASYASNKSRWVHVYDRDGNWVSCLEPLMGIQDGGLAWRPNGGSLIALPRILPSGKSVIALMEKNGLSHGEIPLELMKEDFVVREVSWNATGSILSLSLYKEETNEQILCLLSSSNYTWEMKFVRVLRSKNLYRIHWDESQAHLLRLESMDEIRTLRFTLKTSQSDFCMESDRYRHLAVVDGLRLKITPFGLLTLPPPSSAYELLFKDFIREVTFGGDLSLSVLTEDGSLHVFNYGDNSGRNDEFDGLVRKDLDHEFMKGFLYKTYECVKITRPLDFGNLTWISHGVYLASVGHKLIRLSGSSSDEISSSLPADILNITYSPDFSIVQLVDGRLYSYTDGQLTPWEHISSFPEPCQHVQILYGRNILLGLSESHRLYANDKEISPHVNSFARTSDFLLLTTNRHVLKIFNLSDLSVPQVSRSLERGSSILMCLTSSILLQMPRGNLESFAPRPLILHYVKKQLDAFNYVGIFPLLRKHRINLNILVDHDPIGFKARLSDFIEGMETNNLCLFISELLNEDVTRTIYGGMYGDRKTSAVLPGKVDGLCAELLKALSDTKRSGDSKKANLPLICCQLKHSSKRVAEALRMIDNLRKSGQSSEAESCLSYMSLLLDPNEIFNGALSTYDLDFVVYVASKATSKDPKEYVPFLNQLRALTPHSLRHYAIQKHLGNSSAALSQASEPDFPTDKLEDVLSLVKSQRLYAVALRILQDKKVFYEAIADAYGEYLSSKKYHRDAALVYELGGQVDKAARAWIEAGDWRRGLSSSKGESGVRRVCEILRTERRFEELGEVYGVYCTHPEEAIAAYLEGGHWGKALELMNRLDRKDMLETNYLPALDTKYYETLGFIRDSAKAFHQKTSRLSYLLSARSKKEEEGHEPDEENDMDCDAFSERSALSAASSRRSSNRSLNTLLTKASSSRDKRKLAKKLYSSKEGSTYEDIALVAELHGIISKVYAFKAETGDILSALLEQRQISEASVLQKEYKSLLEAISRELKNIWIKEEEPSDERGSIEQPNGSDHSKKDTRPPYQLLESQFQFPPQEARPNDSSWEIQLLNSE